MHLAAARLTLLELGERRPALVVGQQAVTGRHVGVRDVGDALLLRACPLLAPTVQATHEKRAVN